MDELLFRQGDILLRRVSTIPDGLPEVARDAGRIVLAYGEVTGHAHAIAAPPQEACLLGEDEQRRFLRLMATVELRHPEHATLAIPAGSYQVVHQRVWTDADGDREEAWRFQGD